MDYDRSQQWFSEDKIKLSEPSVMPIYPLGELILPGSSLFKPSTSRILWSTTCSLPPCHMAFVSESSKLFTCTEYGNVSVYDCTTSNISLINSFYLRPSESLKPAVIKSLTAFEFILVVIFNSSIESSLHFYLHNGHLLYSLSLSNEFISQIRYDSNYLWCLELMNSTLFYYFLESNHAMIKSMPKRIEFISFKQQSFNPFRFAINETLVAIMDRSLTGIIQLFDKQTSFYLKQIKCPLNDIQPFAIELTNQILIYRFPHILLLTSLDNEQSIEEIQTNRNLSITKYKSDTEVLVSMPTDDNSTFIIKCYAR